MAGVGKTQQYKGLSDSVKNHASKETEPKISIDKVTTLFNDFGYTPEQSDLTYWTHQPLNSTTKLVNDLQARKEEEKANLKDQQTKEQGPTHLTDQQITKIYSEYGFPLPKSSSDFSWIRQNFPDDEEKMRAIFDIKRKQTDQALKLDGQNTLNTIKQKSQMATAQPQPMLPQATPMMNPQMSGQGGPGDGSTQSSQDGGTQLIFPSRYAVVKFSGDPNDTADGDATTLWLLDSQTKQLQPFLSMQGFNQVFGDNAPNILKKVAVFNPNDLLPSGSLSGFSLLNNTYGIDDNGNIPVPDVNQGSVRALYGQTPNNQSVTGAYSTLDGYLSLLKQNPGSGIDGGIIDSTLNDHTQVAKYISALAYGGYTLNDVYSDLKRKELISKGDSSLKNTQIIDSNLTKQQYTQTKAGQLVQSLPNIQPPVSIGNLNSSVLNSPITQLPDEAFKTLVPALDINNPDFQEQINKVQSAFHDILLAQVNATTDSQKALADNDYNEFRKTVERTYGMKLSSDATQAWGQLQKIAQESSQGNISGSGIEYGQKEDVLKQARLQDIYERQNKLSDIEKADASKAIASASPADIQRMNQEDASQGLPKQEWRSYRWGLIPSDELVKSLDINNLKAKYPDQSEKDLENMRSQILDENGNYRSSLYQNLANNKSTIQYGGTMASLFPTVGSEQTAKENIVLNKNLKQQEDASAPYTMSDPTKPFDNLGTTKTNVPVTVPKTLTGQDSSVNIDNGIKTNLNSNDFTVKQTTTTPAVKTTSANPSTTPFVIKQGTSYIPNVASMGKYTNIYKDPNSKKLYGTLK